jgi:hypothetical protein
MPLAFGDAETSDRTTSPEVTMPNARSSSRIRLLATAVFLATAAVASADLAPEWVARVPAGASLSSGIAGIVVDGGGSTYVTATTGASSSTNILTAAFGPDGGLRWSRTFNGPAGAADQARGIALGPGGLLYVTGNTAGPGSYAQVLVLAYDVETGNLVRAIQYSSGPGTSEYGASIAVDPEGRLYVAGGTVGDGADALIVSFGADGAFAWKRTWDGPAWGPYSQDGAQEIVVDPSGQPVVLIHGVMASSHPDYVVLKLAPATGATTWQATWGVGGGDYPRDMEIDAFGDVYVTGTGIDFIDKFSTIKVRGTDGTLVWQAYDAVANDHSAAAITLDGVGGVYVTGSADPEGNHSNFNDDIYTVKRAADSGVQLWTHRYGAPCVGCYDVPSDVIVDPSGHVFVAGSTSSPPYSGDAILLVLDAATGLETDRGILAVTAPERAAFRELRFDGAFNVLAGGQISNANTGAVDLSVAKYAAQGGGAPSSPCTAANRKGACPVDPAGPDTRTR